MFWAITGTTTAKKLSFDAKRIESGKYSSGWTMNTLAHE